eukprot:5176548-Prymnesium_polylepis.1
MRKPAASVMKSAATPAPAAPAAPANARLTSSGSRQRRSSLWTKPSSPYHSSSSSSKRERSRMARSGVCARAGVERVWVRASPRGVVWQLRG